MKWKLTPSCEPKSTQDLRVRAMLKEMAEFTFATYATSFEEHFKRMVKELPKTNNYSADLMYKVTQRNHKSVEIWKLTPAGDFKYKLCQLDYIGG